VNSTNKPKARGRPRRFDPQEAVATAQALFHEHGYDAVSVSDITKALGINPPSFYAAFDSKAGLYARVLDHWSETGAIPLAGILREDRPVAEALGHLLDEAARRYSGACGATGCLVIEGTRCNDRDARGAACAYNQAAESAIRTYIAARHPEAADRVTDFVSTTMSGLSAKARDGHSLDQLLASARLASAALAAALA
jgi:TetR/AcrR family transcriptional repressor for divergent bdcA